MAGLSVWEQMGYTPPRGNCNHKDSLLSPRCPCQRFMLHPIKMATAFECDGCGHHASFHSIENKEEEAVARRWKEEEKERERDRDRLPNTGSRKRRKAIENGSAASGIVVDGRVGNGRRGLGGSTAARNRRARRLNSPSEGDARERVVELSDG